MPVTTGAPRAHCTCDSRHTLSAELPLQVMRKADLIRKNMAESVKNERNILAMANNPFVVGTACKCLPGWHRKLMRYPERTRSAAVTWPGGGGGLGFLMHRHAGLQLSPCPNLLLRCCHGCTAAQQRSFLPAAARSLLWQLATAVPKQLHVAPWCRFGSTTHSPAVTIFTL